MSTKRTRKRKTTRKPVDIDELPEELYSTAFFQGKAPTYRPVRCIYSTRLVINNAPSGRVYKFLPGERKDVEDQDYEFLLSLGRKQDQAVCCGGGAGQNISYFEGV